MNKVIYFCHDCRQPVGKTAYVIDGKRLGEEIRLCEKCAMKRGIIKICKIL